MNTSIGFVRNLARHPTDLPAFTFAWLESLQAARLAKFADVPNWHDPNIWTTGRLFGEIGEYQWRRNPDGTLHGVLLLEGQVLPKPFAENAIPIKPKGKDAYLILWGDWVNPLLDPQGNPDGDARFYAPEIPRIQEYPIDSTAASASSKTPRLWVRRYWHDTQGEFLRCVGFTMKGEGDDQAQD
jgi:hypothetical protein